MKKNLIRISAFVIGLVVILLVLIFAGTRFLETPEGSKWAMSHVQAILAKDFATELKFSNAELNLFSKIHLTDLKVDSKMNGNHIHIDILNFDLEYSLELLSRNLRIKTFIIDQPHFTIEFKSKSAGVPPPSQDGLSGMQSLAKMIRSPPLKIELENFEIRGLDLDLKMDSDDKQILSQIHQLSFQSKFSLLKDQLLTEGQLKASQANSFELLDPLGHVAGRWVSDSQWKVNINLQSKDWYYQFTPLHFNLVLSDLAVNQKNSDSSTQILIPSLSVSSDTQVEAQTRELFEFDVGSIKIASDHSKILTGVISLLKKTSEKNMSLKIESSDFVINSELKKDVEIYVNSEIKNLDFPEQLFSPGDLNFKATTNLSKDFKFFESQFAAELAGIKLAQGRMTIERKQVEDPWGIQGLVDFFADRKLARKLKAAEALNKTGTFALATKFKGSISNDKDVQLESHSLIERIYLPASKDPFSFNVNSQIAWQNRFQKAKINADLNLANLDFGNWQIKTTSEALLANAPQKEISGTTEVAQTLVSLRDVLPVKILKPMNFKHQIKMDADALTATIRGEVPLVDALKFGVLRDTHFDLKVIGDHMSTEKNLAITAGVDQGGMQLKGQVPEIPITSMKMNLVAKLKQQTYFNLEQFQFTLNDDLVKVTADGAGNLNSKDIQIQMNSHLLFPKNFPEVFGQKISGEILVPLNIAVRRARDISIDGTLDFKNLGVVKGDMSVEGFKGLIPFSEHLIHEKGEIRFTELVTQNAFERVNFERLRPLLQSSDQITIQKLHWQEKTYGPLNGFFSIRQNMLILHEFNLDLGSGSLYGEMFFDAYPKNLQFGLLSRMTGIDLGQVLPKKFLNKIPEGDKTISARTGFVFSINKAVLNGRIDVTQIGSAQMLTLVNVLDPQFQDDKMNKLRRLLEAGYPTAVAFNFNQGYLDLDLDLVALGVSVHEALYSIPLSGFLLKPTAEIISASQKGPLK